MGLFGKEDELVVPWEKIRKIGMDVILVELPPYHQQRDDISKY
ncbi:hypothetical protein N752_08925 [Desulforamulus aquiferis]|nr:hypothetical protein N752_08925 [Desulforamulus aquiferis]